jgi:hypothetical protein
VPFAGRVFLLGAEAMPHNPAEAETFSREAAGRRPGLARELWDFLKENKKWWLIPILVALAIVAALAILGGTGLAPFIYTVF